MIQQSIQLAQGSQEHFLRDQMLLYCIGEFIQVYDFYLTIRIDQNIGKQVDCNIGIRLRLVFVGNDITVPADQPVLVIVELTYFDALLPEKAGNACLGLFGRMVSQEVIM